MLCTDCASSSLDLRSPTTKHNAELTRATRRHDRRSPQNYMSGSAYRLTGGDRELGHTCSLARLVLTRNSHVECAAYLIRKSSFLSLVPFISSRIHTGLMPRPDHFTEAFFLLRYF